MSNLTIKTNNVPRLMLYSHELTAKELQHFDYLGADELEESSFVRYRGRVYSIGDFMRSGAPDGWHGVHGDSFFSGVVIRLCEDDSDRVVMGTCFC